MPLIHSTTLLHARKGQNLSQGALASLSGVSAKQISRLEQGDKTTSCNAATVKRLAKALEVSEDKLGGPKDADDKELRELGYRKASFYTSALERLHYWFLKDRYGVEPNSIILMAPLLFLIAADCILKEREDKLTEVEERLAGVPKHPHHSGLNDCLMNAQIRPDAEPVL